MLWLQLIELALELFLFSTVKRGDWDAPKPKRRRAA
jgi:hypothetical protein